jgi:excisionase family DNA binding protein
MKYYTAEEAAKKLKVSTGHIYELVKRGEIKKKEGMGRTVRIPASELSEISTEKRRFTYDESKVEVIETHLGKVRTIKDSNLYVAGDIAKCLGISNTKHIYMRAGSYTRIDGNEAKVLGLPHCQRGLILLNIEEIRTYSDRSTLDIDWELLFKELKVDKQISTDEAIEESTQCMKLFEGHQVEIIIENGQPLFELYSTGKALGYSKWNGRRTHCTPAKDRIDKVLENADIKILRCGEKYLTETQLYDFMLEAKTEKCKIFRKWVTNEVLPTIRKTGGYVDNSEKFVDNYFINLSKSTKETILTELENKNKALIAERVKIDKELLDNADVIEKIQETLEDSKERE